MVKDELNKDAQEESNTELAAISLLKHIKELSQLKYDSELKREDSLIQQSSQMQTVFSFMTAAIFMAVPVIMEYRRVLTLNFFLVALSSIVFFLLVSLVTASLAQQRKKHNTFPDIDDLEKFIEKNWESSIKESQQLKQWIELVGKVQKEKANINEERVMFIRISMWSFYVSVILIVFWFISGIVKML